MCKRDAATFCDLFGSNCAYLLIGSDYQTQPSRRPSPCQDRGSGPEHTGLTQRAQFEVQMETRTQEPKAEVITRYLAALQTKLSGLKSGDTAMIQGTDAISLLFPPGISAGDLEPRAEAIIGAFAESYRCDYDYHPDQGTLRFIKR
jgi:hypothetical protein